MLDAGRGGRPDPTVVDLEEAVDAVDLLVVDRPRGVLERYLPQAAFERRVRPLIPGQAARPEAPELVAALVQASDPLRIPGERADQ